MILKQESESVETDNNKTEKTQKISPELVDKLSEVLKDDWKTIAAKFGYQSDEVCHSFKFIFLII